MRVRIALAAPALACVLAAASMPAHAGVVNPDISLIGQPVMRWTDDPASAAARRAVLDVGETELMVDSPLNPYARGTAVMSFTSDAVSVEEAFFLLERGLPAGLQIKGGKYRVGFGKLNPAHPHTYPFADRPHVLAAYLPGDDGFNDTGAQLSERFALPGDIAFTISGDWLQGDSFRSARTPSGATNDPLAQVTAAASGPDRASEPRPAGLGRASAFVPIGDRSGLELGSSFTQGTNDVAAATRTNIWGADAKLKYWTSASAYLLVQAEWLGLHREDAGWDSTAAAYTKTTRRDGGGYAFVDMNFNPRYDAGLSVESFQDPARAGTTTSAFGVFAGVALMEETTSFRIGWEREHLAALAAAAPGALDGHDRDVNTVTVRVLYSMGPHKAHQF